MDYKTLKYVIVPRRDGGFFVAAFGTEMAELSCAAQTAADVHGNAIICKCEDAFTDQTAPRPRPKGEKPLVMPVTTKQHKARTKDKKDRKSAKSSTPPSPVR